MILVKIVNFLARNKYINNFFLKYVPDQKSLFNNVHGIMEDLKYSGNNKQSNAQLKRAQQISVSLSLVVISIKLAEIDKPINNKEINYVVKILNFNNLDKWKLMKIISDAKQDNAPPEQFIAQFKRVYSFNQNLYSDLMDLLFNIAKSDGPLNSQEVIFLRNICSSLNFCNEQFRTFLRYHTIADYQDPYQILGIPKNTNLQNLEKAYKNYIKTCHPDKLGINMDKDLADIMNEKFIKARESYNYIRNKVAKKKKREDA